MRLVRRLLGVLGIVAALGVSALPALAAESEVDRRTREIAEGLRCTICSNLSVADSPSQLARDMRTIIRQRVERGESREQIEQYFVRLYPNEGILLDPPKRGASLFVWGGPVLALLGGGAVLTLALVRWTAGRRGTSNPVPRTSDLARYEELLREDRRRLRDDLGT